MTKTTCEKCGKEIKVTHLEVSEIKDVLEISYCPKCETHESTYPLLSVFKAKALRRIDGKTGEFRLRIRDGKEKKDIIVKTFPHYEVVKPFQVKMSTRGQIYTTKEKIKGYYPYIRSGDNVVGFGLGLNFNPHTPKPANRIWDAKKLC